MTNKPNSGVYVSRELLERIINAMRPYPDDFDGELELTDLLAQPADQQGEPAAWVNDQQLLLCSRSPLDVDHPNPNYHKQPRNIAGSALRTDYCNTPLYATAKVDERGEFEKAVVDKAERFHPDLTQYGDNSDAEYRDAKIEWAWQLWQARAKLNGGNHGN